MRYVWQAGFWDGTTLREDDHAAPCPIDHSRYDDRDHAFVCLQEPLRTLGYYDESGELQAGVVLPYHATPVLYQVVEVQVTGADAGKRHVLRVAGYRSPSDEQYVSIAEDGTVKTSEHEGDVL